jgi:hypothetical protein
MAKETQIPVALAGYQDFTQQTLRSHRGGLILIVILFFTNRAYVIFYVG